MAAVSSWQKKHLFYARKLKDRPYILENWNNSWFPPPQTFIVKDSKANIDQLSNNGISIKMLEQLCRCIRLSAEPYVFMIWRPKVQMCTRMSNVPLSIVMYSQAVCLLPVNIPSPGPTLRAISFYLFSTYKQVSIFLVSGQFLFPFLFLFSFYFILLFFFFLFSHA